jgi:hypothetical protein
MRKFIVRFGRCLKTLLEISLGTGHLPNLRPFTACGTSEELINICSFAGVYSYPCIASLPSQLLTVSKVVHGFEISINAWYGFHFHEMSDIDLTVLAREINESEFAPHTPSSSIMSCARCPRT